MNSGTFWILTALIILSVASLLAVIADMAAQNRELRHSRNKAWAEADRLRNSRGEWSVK